MIDHIILTVSDVERSLAFYEAAREYLLYLRNKKEDSWSTLQVNRGALKFLYCRVLKQKWFDDEIAAPKRRPESPIVLSVEQITQILTALTT